MLNISSNRSIRESLNEEQYSSFRSIEEPDFARRFLYVLGSLLLVTIAFAFLPWRQNVIAKGYVTTLRPEQRPQTVQSVIGGRIEKWYVREGDTVFAGDTIAFISDVKDQYFDPDLLERTREQISAKKSSALAYTDKASSLERQIVALETTRDLKISQAENALATAHLNVESDSMKLVSAVLDFETATIQFEREQALFDKGLTSKTDLEDKRVKMLDADAKKTSARNALQVSRNDLLNARIQLSTIANEFSDKLAKAYADRYSVLSQVFDANGEIAKMTNQLANYSIRYQNYAVTAPQTGLITEALRVGIGEVIKEGERLISIMPLDYQPAVEMLVRPVDIPLFSIGNDIRFIFDGWPAVVFSGWPDLSYGTFSGRVFAIDRFTGGEGTFRVLIAPNPDKRPWPQALSIGTGAKSIALLKQVPVWYEIWRRLNGFPPDYYQSTQKGGEPDKTTMKTLKRLK